MSIRHPISVVIPAFNAALTIEATINSLRAQTDPGWEAVVVDDGSTDQTSSIVESLADADSRVRLIHKANAGVSAARNTGTDAARYPWLLYLDADDLLAPKYFEYVTNALAWRRTAKFAHTSWARMAPDSRLFHEYTAMQFPDLFDVAARHCPFSVHSIVVRKDLVVDVGGWDESLTNCEDWDLWARIARTGADFVVATEALAIYRTRPLSASFDGRQMLKDGIVVLARTHAVDPRVKQPLLANYRGRDHTLLDDKVLSHAAWCAGQVIGLGHDAVPLLDMVQDRKAPLLDVDVVSHCLDVAGSIGSMDQPLWLRWEAHSKLFISFLERLEAISGAPRLASRVELQLARQATDSAASSRSIDLGRVWAFSVDVHQLMPRLDVPVQVDRVRVRATADGLTLGHVEVTVANGVVTPQQLQDAIVGQLSGALLEHYAHAVAGQPNPLSRKRSADASSNTRIAALLFGTFTNDPPLGKCRWSGECRIELSAPFPDIITTPNMPLDIIACLGGQHVGTFRLTSRTGSISAGRVRATVAKHAMTELTRAAVSVGIIGRPVRDGETLSERLRTAAEYSQPTKRSVRHINVSTVPALWLKWVDSKPNPTRRARQFAAVLPPNQRRHLKELYQTMQAVPLFGAGRTRVPVLMYHRVSPSGEVSTDRWRVAPQQFDDHLVALRRAGYTGITMAEFGRILYEGARAPRRPLVLTFDDGYSDFAEYALPRLKARRFGATVFVVAGEVGATNRWDDVFDYPAQLMGWETLREIAAAGVDLGSHSFDHPMLTALSNEQVRMQAVRSKQLIESETGIVVRSFAYPYGDVDQVVAGLVEDAGYQLAVTCERGPVDSRAHPLLLPRVEVKGSMSARTLVADLARLRSDRPGFL